MRCEPSQQDINEFLENVFPIVRRVVAETAFKFRKRDNPETRACNLAIGRPARSKAEAAFQADLLHEIARIYPGKTYPAMCPPPPQKPKPSLKVVGDE